MIFLTIATLLVAAITLLEIVDPGILSTALPLPVVWAALVASWCVHGRGTGRGKPAPTRMRIALTAAVGLTTMAGAILLLRSAAWTLPAAVLAGIAAGAACWTLMEPNYDDHPLPQDRA